MWSFRTISSSYELHLKIMDKVKLCKLYFYVIINISKISIIYASRATLVIICLHITSNSTVGIAVKIEKNIIIVW